MGSSGSSSFLRGSCTRLRVKAFVVGTPAVGGVVTTIGSTLLAKTGEVPCQ